MFQCPAISLSLLYVFIADVSCYVPPPTNLSLNCHNFQNVLYWNYSEQSVHQFNVTIRYYDGQKPQSLRTSQNHLDISSYTQYVDNAYFVTVVAQPNGSENHSSRAVIQFSYGEFPSKAKCVVDFPPLNVSVWSHSFEIKFFHPSYIYGIEILNDTFTYTVEYNEIESTYSCLVQDWVCSTKIHLPDSLYGSCVKVHFTGFVEGIRSETFKNVCSSSPDPVKKDTTTLITGLVCSAIVLVITILVGGVLYMKRNKIKSPVLSKIMSKGSNHAVIVPEQPILSPVMSVSNTPLLETPVGDVFTPTYHSDESHFPICSFPDMESSGSQLPEGMVEEEDPEGAKSSTGYDCAKCLDEIIPVRLNGDCALDMSNMG